MGHFLLLVFLVLEEIILCLLFTLQRNKEIIINKRIVNNEHKYNNSEAGKKQVHIYCKPTKNKNQLAAPTELVNIFNLSTRRQI